MPGDDGIKLFVYGISASCPRDVLEDKFGKCGRVNDVFNTGKGYAFITMDDEKDAQDAVDELHGTTIDGQEVKVELSKPRSGGGGGRDRDRGYGGGRDRRGGGGFGDRRGGGDRDRGYGGGRDRDGGRSRDYGSRGGGDRDRGNDDRRSDRGDRDRSYNRRDDY